MKLFNYNKDKMNSSEFIQAGQRITGVKHGYQKPFADALGVSVMTVKRYAAGECNIPLTIQKLINTTITCQKLAVDYTKNLRE